MKVKRFAAPNAQKALALIKKELGAEAVILSSKNLAPRQGSPAWVEMVAAVDFDLETVNSPFAADLTAKGPIIDQRTTKDGDSSWAQVFSQAKNGNYPGPGGKGADSPNQPQPKPLLDPYLPRRHGNNGWTRRSSPLLPPDEQSLTRVSFSYQAHHLRQRFADSAGECQDPVPLSIPPTLEQATTTIKTRNSKHLERGKNPQRPSPEEVVNWRKQILDQLLIHSLELNEGTRPSIVALVGSTGVGKTTTAAKIAAWFSLRKNAKVAMISMDCYRLGATDQLRTYARIMHLPCELTLDQRDLNIALNKHRHKDLIIIDTTGKSPFDEQHILKLNRWFSPHRINPYLVLSATTKKEDTNHIIATYRSLEVSAAILTKLDETRAYAALCQQMTRAELPIACLCTGQKVPEDFFPASKEFLKTLFGYGWDAAMNQQSATAAQDGWVN